MTAIYKVAAAATISLISMVQRRSQRSANVPVRGESKMRGARVHAAISANRVTDPVLRSTHSPSANPERPEPSSETTCPLQIVRNVFHPVDTRPEEVVVRSI